MSIICPPAIPFQPLAVARTWISSARTKGSPLAEILRDAFNVLIANGTYGTVMKKWGLENNQIKQAGINQGQ